MLSGSGWEATKEKPIARWPPATESPPFPLTAFEASVLQRRSYAGQEEA